MDDFGGRGCAFVDRESADGDWQAEATRTAGAGVKVQNTFMSADFRLVRVAEENN